MTQAGWYDDPESPDAQRYWDGQQWTSRRQRKAGATSPQPSTSAQHPVPPTEQLRAPTSPKASSIRLKPGLIFGAVILAIVTAALVTGRVLLGTFLPGLLVLAAIVLACVILAIRSQRRSRAGKGIFIGAVAVVTALAVPLSMRIVYPTYHYFFPSVGTQVGGRTAGAAATGDSTDESSAPPHIPAGILMVNTSDWTFGVVDPDSGKYTEVTKFKVSEPVLVPSVSASADLTKFAVLGAQGAGWIDANGTFTNVAPEATPSGPTNFSIGFDRAGNFFFGREVGRTVQVNGEILDIYKVPAGSTSGAQKVQSAVSLDDVKAAWLDYDGSIHFGCKPRQSDVSLPVSWIGPDAIMILYDSGVEKAPIGGRDDKGCLTLGQEGKLTPEEDTFGEFQDAVAKRDGSKIAFLAYMSAPSMASLGNLAPSQPLGSTSIFITDGNGQPTRLNTPNLSDYSHFVRWD